MKSRKTKIIVTSGPTREFIDPIRFLSNPSTGKMGHFIAKAAVNNGYRVTYICGPVNNRFNRVENAENVTVVSTVDLLEAVKKSLEDNCVLIMAAAPADYRPEKRFDRKMKKADAPSIHLVPNPDILKTIAAYADETGMKVRLVGFAAETHRAYDYARNKLESKKLDMIFLNDLSRYDSGFGVDTNQLTVIRKDGTYDTWEAEKKERLGYKIINELKQWLGL